MSKQNYFETRQHSGLVMASLALLLAAAGCESARQEKENSNRAWLVSTNQEPAKAPPPRMPSTIAPAPGVRSGDTRTGDAGVVATGGVFPSGMVETADGEARRYSFKAEGLDVRDALSLFARNHDLNIVADTDVLGTVSVDFKNLTLDKSMEAILGSFGYYAEMERGLVRVRNMKTEVFTVDYLRLIRSGNGTSTANISSGSGQGGGSMAGGVSTSASGTGGTSGGGVAGGDSTSVSINKSDSVDFWTEIEAQLKSLLSSDGRLAINKVAGTILVTDQKSKVDRIAMYLREIKKTLHRQVDLEAQIYEVVLNDEFHLGVDWENVMVKLGEWAASSGGPGMGIPSSRLIVDNPIGGNTPGQPALSLAITKDETKIVVDALREMGNLEVVSQPRIRTLNNQAAMIKVGTDKPFFRKNTIITTSNGGTQTQTDVEVRTITIGTILSLTPQISDDGWITMDISPVITRLVATATGPDESTAPEVDIKQASSLVRIPQGSTVVIGGLIQRERYKTTRKVPGLGDIPVLGYPFRGVYDDTRRTELVIFITPTLVE